jgi:sensor histidine kinase YesM
VFSICICGIATLLIDGSTHLLWRNKKPPRISFVLLALAAIPIAYIAGNLLAITLLGIPRNNVFANQFAHATPILILCGLATGFCIWLFSSRARIAELSASAAAEKARATAIEKQALQAQLQLLQTQIEPHMLFNTLANLQGLIATDAPRAQRMLDQLIQYLRATLSSSRAEKTTLAQEFALMEAYLGLMSIRMGTRLSYALHLPEDLRHAALPPMLLQPLVENAIKHGIEPKIDGGRIEVSAAIEGNFLALTIIDDGMGLEERPPNAHASRVGLANVRERLFALFGRQAILSLSPNAPAGAIARIVIPS